MLYYVQKVLTGLKELCIQLLDEFAGEYDEFIALTQGHAVSQDKKGPSSPMEDVDWTIIDIP